MLLDDVEAYLTSFGAYTQAGTTYTVRKYFTPDTPDATITLLGFPAGPAVRAMGPALGAPIRERHGLMVVVRGPQKEYGNAQAMAEVVYQRLDNFHGVLSTRQYDVTAMHPPMVKEEDRNARWRIETNFLVMKERG